MKSAKEISLACSSYHLSFKNLLVEVQLHLFRQGAHISHINSILMEQLLYTRTINQEYCCIIKHFGKTRDMILLYTFTSICKLELALRIRSFTDLAENNIRQRSTRANHNLRSQISYRFDDVTINKQGPQLSYVYQVKLWRWEFNDPSVWIQD